MSALSAPSPPDPSAVKHLSNASAHPLKGFYHHQLTPKMQSAVSMSPSSFIDTVHVGEQPRNASCTSLLRHSTRRMHSKILVIQSFSDADAKS